jgi:hypothetical protein
VKAIRDIDARRKPRAGQTVTVELGSAASASRRRAERTISGALIRDPVGQARGEAAGVTPPDLFSEYAECRAENQ